MPIKNSDFNIKRKIAILTLRWCQENIGVNKKKRNIKLSLRSKPYREGNYIVLGHFCHIENRILLYDVYEQSLIELVKTIIHEYTHYLQSSRKYWEYYKTHYYSQHPYERQAKRNEMKYGKICLKEIKKLIN